MWELALDLGSCAPAMFDRYTVGEQVTTVPPVSLVRLIILVIERTLDPLARHISAEYSRHEQRQVHHWRYIPPLQLLERPLRAAGVWSYAQV